MKKPKNMAALIVAKMRGKPMEEDSEYSEEEESSEGDDQRMGLVAASEEILSAMESKDAEALTDALMSFIEQC